MFVCPQWFRSAVIKENAMPEGLMTLLFSNIDPIYEFHRGFLKEIDLRLALWYQFLFKKFKLQLVGIYDNVKHIFIYFTV